MKNSPKVWYPNSSYVLQASCASNKNLLNDINYSFYIVVTLRMVFVRQMYEVRHTVVNVVLPGLLNGKSERLPRVGSEVRG